MNTIQHPLFRSFPLFLASILVLAAFAAPRAASAAEPEIRAFWIEAWSNGLKTPSQVNQLISDVQAGNFNTIIPQVRRRGDAFYESNIEPRTNDSTVPDGYDPLADLIAKAHAANPPIEVHAWIVVYPIWRVGHSRHPDPNHIYNREPDWLTVSNTGDAHDGSNYQVDPGHPDVQQHTFDVAMDLLTNYDIDGIHYDYVRYSGRAWGYNPVAVERFNHLHGRSGTPSTTDSAWMQFRRDQVTHLVRKIYLSAIDVKPELKMSAATITWAPGPSSLSEWYNNSSAYRSVLQDWRGWMEEGILDLNVPMAYFREHTHADDWMKWINFAKDHRYDRHVAIGPGLWLNSIENTVTQFRDTRAPSPAGNFGQGVSGYSYQGTNNEGLPRSALLNALTQPSGYDPIEPPMFADNAPVPEMPWKTTPTTGHLKGFVRNAYTDLPADGALVHLSGETERTIQADATGFFGFVDLPPGNYRVSASWLDSEENSPEAMLTVFNGKVAHQDLSFNVPADGGGGDGEEIILDNEDEEVTYTGGWNISTNTSGYGPTYHWTETDSQATRFATYTPNLPEAGHYKVDTWYFESWNRAPDARFTVSDGENEEVVLVDQLNEGREWIILAEEIFLDPANNPTVTLDNLATNNVVIADAVRWTHLDPTFEPDLEFSITAEIEGEGSIDGLPANGTASHGATLDLEAIGENGYQFSHWEGNAWGSDNPLSLEVGSDLEIRAVFISAYSDWVAENFSEAERDDPAFTAPDADPYGHGIPNRLKFAFDLDVKQPDRSLLPAIEPSPDGFTLTFRRLLEPGGLEYLLEFSSDLQNWAADPGRVEEISAVPDDGKTETVTVKVSPNGNGSLFLRLSIDQK